MLNLEQFDGHNVHVTYTDEDPDTGRASYDGSCAFWPYTPVLLVHNSQGTRIGMIYNEGDSVCCEDAGGCTLHVAQVTVTE